MGRVRVWLTRVGDGSGRGGRRGNDRGGGRGGSIGWGLAAGLRRLAVLLGWVGSVDRKSVV